MRFLFPFPALPFLRPSARAPEWEVELMPVVAVPTGMWLIWVFMFIFHLAFGPPRQFSGLTPAHVLRDLFWSCPGSPERRVLGRGRGLGQPLTPAESLGQERCLNLTERLSTLKDWPRPSGNTKVLIFFLLLLPGKQVRPQRAARGGGPGCGPEVRAPAPFLGVTRVCWLEDSGVWTVPSG